MSSSTSSSDFLYCLIRKKMVQKTKEECVRQKLLHALIFDLGFPISGIMVEKKISELPHLACTQKIPNRRIDIVCYAKDLHTNEYVPLLLAECKAVAFTQKAKAQIFGYNYFIKAKYLALVNEHKEDVYSANTQRLPFSHIPRAEEILNF